MDYSKLSDQKINASVAKIFPDRFMFNEDGNPYELVPDSGAAYTGIDFEEVEFDPCNSWADAGKIIEENKISLVYDPNLSWTASPEAQWVDGVEWQIDGVIHSNPLRAGMIVFLMMQSVENKNS